MRLLARLNAFPPSRSPGPLPLQSPITHRFEGERILLTGGTGFLAKSLLERIFTTLPGVAHIHLLVRPKNGVSLIERVRRDVFSSDVFDDLRGTDGDSFDSMLANKISVVGGDLTQDRFGLSADEYESLTSNVTLVLNCAAACSFDEPLDQALQTNTLGAKRVLEFARDAGDAPLVHVSTCYVGATFGTLVAEKPLSAGHTPDSTVAGTGPAFDLDSEVRSLLDSCAQMRERDDLQDGEAATIELGRQQALMRGWHDVYQFTKALGEQYLSRDHRSVPLSIVRPSIIESTYEAPYPGWIDGVRMADPMIMEYGRGNLLRFVGSTRTVLDLVPCDMVSNLILASVPPRGAVGHRAVYQLASSTWNPLTLGDLTRYTFEAFTKLAKRHPSKISAPARRGHLVSEARFRGELSRKRRLLEWSRALQGALGFRRAARRSAMLLRVVARAEKLTDMYAFYASTSPSFDVSQTRDLLDDLTADDRAAFSFDLSKVDWRDYVTRRHIPGLLRLGGFDSTRS